MSESARRLKANRVMEGRNCAACGRAIAFGDDVAICTECETLHDVSCWDGRGGCAKPGCVNAPLERLAQPAAAAPPLPLGKKQCPHCGKVISTRASICPHCKQVPTEDGVYRGPKTDAPGATTALVCGIVGIFVCGVILGIIAIVQATQARKAIASDPRYTGSGKATAGLVLGIIDIAVFALQLVIVLGRRASEDYY